MIRPDLVQSAAIAYLKTIPEIIAELSSDITLGVEIREDQWQGRDFIYPAIRLMNISLKPSSSTNCGLYEIQMNWIVFAEEPSSWRSDKIAGIISSVLHNKQWSNSNLLFYLRTLDITPAIRKDERTWQSVVQMIGTVSQMSE